jgi:hypothetical protein
MWFAVHVLHCSANTSTNADATPATTPPDSAQRTAASEKAALAPLLEKVWLRNVNILNVTRPIAGKMRVLCVSVSVSVSVFL